MTYDVTKEYKDGITDPTRIVGQAERKRGTARKAITELKKKFGNNK